MSSKSVLVTGGAGFLGGHVAERLAAMGHRVVVLDDLSGGFRRNLPAGCTFEQASVLDRDAVDRLFRAHRFVDVFHLAAYAAEALSHFLRAYNYTVNVLGSMHLINAAVNHGASCFVFTSSAAVYGAASPPCREEDAGEPEDPYGIAKLAVERDLAVASAAFGLRHVIFRPHNVYGERQNLSDPYRNVVGIFLRQVLSGRPCAVFGDGQQTRAFTHVGDVAQAIADSPDVEEAANQVFNVGSDEPVAILDLARRVQQALGRDTGVEHLPERREVRHVRADHAKFRRVFGTRPPLSLDEGLARTAAWARGLEIAPMRAFAEVEIERGLPWPRARP